MHVRLLAYYAPNIIIYIHTVLLIDCRFGRTQKPNNWIQKTNETINTSIVDWDMVLFLKAEAICQLYRESSTVYGLQFNCSPLSTSLLRILSFSFDFYPLRIVGWYGPRQPSPHCTHTHTALALRDSTTYKSASVLVPASHPHYCLLRI